MNIHVTRLAMLLIMGSCLKASALAAQSPVPAQQSQVTQVNGTVVVTPNVEPSPEPSRNRPLQRFLNPHGMSCASDFNAYGCGNFWSNFDFMFGSCRTFFGQTCTPNTSHNGAGTAGAGTAAGTQRNCANGRCGN